MSERLEDLLARGEIVSALVFRERLSDREINLVRQAYEAGLSHGREENPMPSPRLIYWLSWLLNNRPIRWRGREYQWTTGGKIR